MKKLTTSVYKIPLLLLFLFTVYICILSQLATYGNTSLFKQFSSKKVQLLVLLIGVLFFSIFLNILYKKIQQISPDRIHLYSVVLLIAILPLQITFYFLASRSLPTTDTCTVIEQALAMLHAQNGKVNVEIPYFQHYSNNYFFLVFLYYFYKVLSVFHISDVWIPTVLLNIVFIYLGIFFTYKIAQRLFDEKKTFFLLILCSICPTTYIWSSFTYTNTFSIPFIMGMLYLFLIIKDAQVNKRTILLSILLGVIIVYGVLIRTTTIIPVIALFITWFLYQLKTKIVQQNLIKIFAIIIAITISLFFWNIIKSHHIPPVNKDDTFPLTHWIMMGVSTDGGFNKEDLAYTSSFKTYDEKRNANLDKISSRLGSLNSRKFLNLFNEKLTRVWGDGSDEILLKAKASYDFPVLYNKTFGTNNMLMVLFIQIFRSCTFLFISISIIQQLRKRELTDIYVFSLALFGCILFFLLWEANRKYNICFIYICLLLMGDGIFYLDKLETTLLQEKKKYSLHKRIKYSLMSLGIFGILFTMTQLIGNYSSLTQKTNSFHNLMNYIGKKHISVLNDISNDGTLLEQSFTANKSFNRIRLHFEKYDKTTTDEQPYTIQLISKADNQLKYETNFGLGDIKDNTGIYTVKLPKNIYDSHNPDYLLRIKSSSTSPNSLGIYYKNIKYLSAYSYGNLTINQEKSPYNLFMQIYNQEKRPYTTPIRYIIFSITLFIVLSLLLIVQYRFLSRNTTDITIN